MKHYLFTYSGFITPDIMNHVIRGRDSMIVTVETPDKVVPPDAGNLTLKPEDNIALPVGDTLSIDYTDGAFRGRLLRDIEAEARKKHDDDARTKQKETRFLRFITLYCESVTAPILSNPSAKAISEGFALLQNAKDKLRSNMEQSRKAATGCRPTCQHRQKLLAKFSRLAINGPLIDAYKRLHQCLIEALAKKGVVTSIAYAYSPSEGQGRNVDARGRVHLQISSDAKVTAGNFIRQRGDALCRTQDKFWGLETLADKQVSCTQCIQRALVLISTHKLITVKKTEEHS